MALDTCNVHHGVKASGHCHSCHKPTCPQCQTRDGCCSERCYQSKVKFAQTRIPKAAPSSWIPTLVGIVVFAAASYGVAKLLGKM